MSWRCVSLLLVLFAAAGPGCSDQPGLPPDDGGLADGLSGDGVIGIDSDVVTESGPGPDVFVHKDQGPQIPCQAHHDCPQGWICYYKKCVNDPLYPLFHCGKQDASGNDTCPPGRRCIDAQGNLTVCAESTSYACKDACDCGPAHCCVDVPNLGKHCVKDTSDPFLPGGTAPAGTGCVPGKDATYCFDDAVCEEARQSYIDAELEHTFLSFNRALGTVSDRCGGRRCFATACNCPPGHACVDLQRQIPAVGKTCHLLSGGFCVSKATAEAVLGIKGSELLDCCSWGCPVGQKCDAGWISDRSWAYRRVVGTCGSCGNGTCDPGEYHASCPKECLCGDGTCEPVEIMTCPQDCAVCGNFICEPDESNQFIPDKKHCPTDCYCGNGVCEPDEATTCSADCTCGDGICSSEEVCAQDCVCPDSRTYSEKGRVCGDGICSRSGCADIESCLSCPADCGPCAWKLASGTSSSGGGPLPAVGFATDAWGDLGTGVFITGTTTKGQIFVYQFDGKIWSSLPPLGQAWSGDLSIWGTSPSDLYVVDGPVMQHYDGTGWTPMSLPSSSSGQIYAEKVWGRSATDVYALSNGLLLGGDVGLLHYDGNAKLQWSQLTFAGTSGTGGAVKDLWGPAGSDELFLVGEKQSSTPLLGPDPAILRCKVSTQTCSAMSVPTLPVPPGIWPPTGVLKGIWGVASGTKLDMFAVGGGGASPPFVWHYDGNTSNTWTAMTGVPAPQVPLPPAPSPTIAYCMPTDVWGRSASEVYVVGECGMILRYDGTSSTSTWTQISSPTTHALAAVWGDTQDLFALVNSSGAILRYDAASQAWTQLSSPGGGASSSLVEVMPGAGIWGTSASNVLALAGSRLLRYDGATWSDESLPTTAPLHGIWGSSATDIFVVGGAIPDIGTGGTPGPAGPAVVLHYDGKTWTQLPCQANGPLFDIWGSKNNAYAVGWDKLWHYDGTTWQSVATIGGNAMLTGVDGCGSPSSPSTVSKVAVVGRTIEPLCYDVKGVVGIYDVATKSWSSTSTPEALLDVRCDAQGKVIAVGGAGAAEQGGPWPPGCAGIAPKVVSCTTTAGSAPSCSMSYQLPLQPTDWGSFYGGALAGGLNGLWDGPSGELYAVGANGLFLRYDGKTWDHVAADIRTLGAGWGCGDLHGIWGTSTGSDLFLQSPGGVLRLAKPGTGP